MTSDPQANHPTLLTESWTTLSASDAHSEDGARSEQTDVGSLIDQAVPDDVTSLDDHTSSEVDGHDDGDEDDQSSGSECQDLPTIFPRGDSIDDSNLTTKAAFHQSTDSIEFIEPEKWPEAERVELKHTIQVFDGDEAWELKEKLPYNLDESLLIATVQQTMVKHSLGIDKPFHVLYIGNSEFRNIILDKIGDVLVSSSRNSFESSSTESSRYHVVPTSFGAGAVPNFAELLPIHVQLIVDECTNATSGPQTDKPSTLSLDFKNRPSCTSSWTGSDYRVSSSAEWTSPDMAILFVSSRDDVEAVKTQKLARAFMERLGVPTMVISEKPLWKMTTELVPVNHHGLHMCLESRNPVTGESVVLRRYPIDLNTFESITPNQLNRNLASLAAIYPKPQAYKTTSQGIKFPAPKPLFDSEKYPLNMLPFSCSSRACEMAPAFRLLTLTIISAIVASLGCSALKVGLEFISQAFTPAGNSVTTTALTGLSTASVLPLDRLKQASVSPTSKIEFNQFGGHSKIEELMGLAPGSEQDGETFEIRVIGDCHVIIKPPHDFLSGGRRPNFKVTVNRHSESVPYELSKLFEGVYTLKLDREDAYGPVNVTISALKPRHTQVTELDFGTPWLKIANWKRAAHVMRSQFTRDFTTAQASVSELCGQVYVGAQVLVEDVVRKSQSLRREGDQLRRDSMQFWPGARDAMLSRAKQVAETVRRNALAQILAASSAVQGHTGQVNKEAKEFVSNTWNSIMASVPDLNTVAGRIREAGGDTLDMAQKRARGLIWRGSCSGTQCSVQSRG